MAEPDRPTWPPVAAEPACSPCLTRRPGAGRRTCRCRSRAPQAMPLRPTVAGPAARPRSRNAARSAVAAAAGAAQPAAERFPMSAGSVRQAGLNHRASTRNQRALVDRVSAYLSSVQQWSAISSRSAPTAAAPRASSIIQKPGRVRFDYDPPSPIDIDRRRPVGGGARPQARDPGPLSAVADAAALPARRPHRSVARHQHGRRLCRRRLRHRGDRGEADRRSAPAA